MNTKMKHKKSTCWAICLSFFLLTPSFVIGDIAPNPVSAPNLRPLQETSVRMVSEVVTVDLYKEGSTVEVLFEMKNLGETETVEVGFPIMDYYFGWKNSLFIGQHSEGDRFKVWVDNIPAEDITIYGFNFQEVSSQEASISHKKRDILKEDSLCMQELEKQQKLSQDSTNAKSSKIAGSQPRIIVLSNEGSPHEMPWYIWNTTFQKGETHRIRVKYSLPKGQNKRNNFFNYILHTGANWNETIGKATINVRLHDIPEEDILRITPNGYTKEDNIISWTFSDFEPTTKDDIYIYYGKENAARPLPEEALVYLDNKEMHFKFIDPDKIGYFSIEKKDESNFPNGAIFIYSKEFEFTLLKSFVRKFSPGIFKELATLEVDEFYDNYLIEVYDENGKRGGSFHNLCTDDVISIKINYNDDKNYLIITTVMISS